MLWYKQRERTGKHYQDTCFHSEDIYLLTPNICLNTFITVKSTEVPAAAAKSLQSCPSLCDPIDGSPPGSPIPGILQARTLEWVAISFSNAWKWKVKVKSLGHVLVIPWATAYQAPPSMGFSRQESWSGVPLPSPNRSPYVLFFSSTFDKKEVTTWTDVHVNKLIMPPRFSQMAQVVRNTPAM